MNGIKDIRKMLRLLVHYTPFPALLEVQEIQAMLLYTQIIDIKQNGVLLEEP